MSQEGELRPPPPLPPALSPGPPVLPDGGHRKPWSTAAISWAVVIVVCALLLLTSARPGGLEQAVPPSFLLVFVGCPCVLVLAVIGVVVLFVRSSNAPRPGDEPNEPEAPHPAPQSSLGFQILLVLVVLIVCATPWPLRIATIPDRPSFEAIAANPPTPGRAAGFIGKWRYTEYDVDSRGGHYFKTGRRGDLIDSYSFGFAYKPNKEGSPFGNAYYRLTPLWGDWYAFRANNDW